MAAFTQIDPNTLNDSAALSALLAGGNLSIDAGSIVYTGAAGAVGTYDGSQSALGIGAGLIMTSGMMPGVTNTSTAFGISNGLAGDADLDAVVNSVFQTVSYDAATLEFTFTVTDSTMTGVSFNVLFGSDEYPEWVNQYVDIAVVIVNGQNVAYFNNDLNAPLSVIGSNLSAGYFVNNAAGQLPIEYDGVSQPLTVYAPVHLGVNTVKIGVADTRDHILDSGIIVSGMTGTNIPITGVNLNVEGTENDDSIDGNQAGEAIHGHGGNDSIHGNKGADVMLGQDGDDWLTGDLDNDFLDGGAGADTLDGGLGDDTVQWSGTDTIDGGDGQDMLLIDLTGQQDALAIDLSGGAQVITLADGSIISNIERLSFIGGAGDDTLAGGSGDDVLNGGDGVDQVRFSGNAADYAVKWLGGSTFRFSDQRATPADGNDVVSNVETLIFADQTLDLTTALPGTAPEMAAGPNHLLAALAPSAANLFSGLFDFSDADLGEAHSVTITPSADNLSGAVLSAGIAHETGVGTPGQISWQLAVDKNNPEIVALAPGKIRTVTFDLTLTDAQGHSVNQQVSFDLVGLNEAPVQAVPVQAAATENGAVVSLDLLAGASDPDTGAVIFATGLGTLPAGVSLGEDGVTLNLDPNDPSLENLSQGETRAVTVNYSLSDGIATTAAKAVFMVTGANDQTQVSGPVTAQILEDQAINLSALSTASDIDHLDVLSVVDLPANLPAGISYQAATKSFLINAAAAPYQVLAAGETTTQSFDYGISDGHATTVAHADITITGQNDAPVAVAGQLNGEEDQGILTFDALSTVSDVDHGASVSVDTVQAILPAGVSYDQATHSFVVDTADAAFQQLGEGEIDPLLVTYTVTDGMAVSQAVLNIAIIGHNDAPVVTGPATINAVEDEGLVFVDAFKNATDIDTRRADLTVVDLPSALPPGVSYDAETSSFVLDTTHSAYQSLARGQSIDVTVDYAISDGYDKTPTYVIFTIKGTNDAPIVAGTVEAAFTEDSGVAAVDLLSKTTDVDGDTLSLASPVVLASVTNWTNPVVFNVNGSAVTINGNQFNSLHAGEVLDLNFSSSVTDGINAKGSVAPSVAAHIQIIGQNDAPTALNLSGSSVMENAGGGTVIAMLSAVDADRGESFTYAIGNDPSGFFAIQGNQLVVANGAALDFETATSHQLTIIATDAGGLFVQKTVAIAVGNQAGVVINGSGGNDVYNNTSNPRTTVEEDTVSGNNGNDSIDGLAGADSLAGNAGNDTLIGGAGADTLDGGGGNDLMQGGDGNDVFILRGTEGQLDVIDGGAGLDTVVLQGGGSITVNGFNATASSIEILDFGGRPISGSGGADLFDFSGLTSVLNRNSIDAGSGADTLIGSNFADDLFGGADADVFRGLGGNDTMKGGAGADRFYFSAGAGNDTIADFSAGTKSDHDILVLDHNQFGDMAAAKAAMTQIGTDVLLTAGIDSVLLKGISIASMVSVDFLFV